MSIDYLKGMTWSRWTRDERFFCSVLYSYAKSDPKDFAEWIIENAGLPISSTGDWDIGFEVCFYRDYLWHQKKSAKKRNLPFKRTFDLCLFNGKAIIIIEAKVCEGFITKQNDKFAEGRKKLKSLPGLESIDVQIIALASSKYFDNCRRSTLDIFKNKKISWLEVALKYNDPLLHQANEMYNQEQGGIFNQNA